MADDDGVDGESLGGAGLNEIFGFRRTGADFECAESERNDDFVDGIKICDAIVFEQGESEAAIVGVV